MARTTLEAWLPEEYESSVIQRINQTSAVESVARKVTMGSDTKNVPRSNGVQVEVIQKGAAYGEDGGANDGITIYARKFGKVIRLAEEDIDDSVADIISVKKNDWATSYAITLDNAALAVTAAENGGSVPFTSVYRALSVANAGTGYLAGANIATAGVPTSNITVTAATDLVTTPQPHGLAVGDKIRVTTAGGGLAAGSSYFVKTTPSTTTLTLSATSGGAVTDITADATVAATLKSGQVGYDNLNALVSLYEASPYFDQNKGVILAHPSVKGQLRGIKNSVGDPLFVAGAPRQGDPDLLFGYPVKWTLGAKTSAVATDSPAGNPLVIIGNSDFLILGVRSGPESVVIDGRSGASALTDETLLKVRARRGFGIGHEKAFGILEIA